MTDTERTPELKTVVGALVFAANRPLSVKEIRSCLKSAADRDETARTYGSAGKKDVRAALDELAHDLETSGSGFLLDEVAGGYRLQSDVRCGTWVKELLDIGKPSRMSLPALETLAIIAYRQPITRNDIEGIRGVSVDHVMKTLMEMQLVRIVGRSELPGRPFLYGTTHVFLEHFGLRSLDDLSEMAPMLRMQAARAAEGVSKEAEETPPGGEESSAMQTDADAGDAPGAVEGGEPAKGASE